MAATTGNTAMDDVFATWLNKNFLTDLQFELQHQRFTAKATMADGVGANIARFNEFAPPLRTGYASGSTALTEASTTGNEITSITTTPTNVTVVEYGEFIKVGKLWEHAAISGSREKIQKRMRDGGAVSIDTVVRLQANQSSNIFYATLAQTGGSATAPATVGAASISMLLGGRKILYDALVTGIEGVPGHTSGNYAAVITSKQELDITTEVTTGRIYWQNCVVQVPGLEGQGRFVKGLIGDCYGISVYRTQNYGTQTLTSACDIGFLYGADGIAAVAFEDMEPQIILNDVNSPYKNVNSIAWHSYFGATLVQTSGSVRVLKMYSLS